ncbi:MAG: sigma factor-like helix-turn-helix DNA-binding protein [Terriglobia bacterium]
MEARVFLAARREAVRRGRARKGLPGVNAAAAEHSAAEWLAQTEQMSLVHNRRELLRRSLNQLPAAQRRVLDMMLYDGLTEEETAAALGEPLGKIRDQARAALAFARHHVHTLMGAWTAGI